MKNYFFAIRKQIRKEELQCPLHFYSVELDLSNPPDVSAMVVCPTGGDVAVHQGGKLASSASIGMTVQKTLSIPMMMRALMKGLNGMFSLWLLEL